MTNPIPTAQPIFDRREQRAIGHFLEMAEKLQKKSDDRFIDIIKNLQKEHGCYD